MGGDGFVYDEAPHDQMVKNDTQMCLSLSSRTKCVSMLSCPIRMQPIQPMRPRFAMEHSSGPISSASLIFVALELEYGVHVQLIASTSKDGDT